ncbi:MAG: hypothetical protein IJF01_07345 [Tidjanibacter sp.]|nr:hypothetical protein [Tidjanibacter sp.]
MKAKIKETGEIVNIADYSTVYLDKYDGSYHINELEFIKDEEKQSIIDWEQRRYEIAKSAMQGMRSMAKKVTINLLGRCID